MVRGVLELVQELMNNKTHAKPAGTHLRMMCGGNLSLFAETLSQKREPPAKENLQSCAGTKLAVDFWSRRN
jgi:hypothetical protein